MINPTDVWDMQTAVRSLYSLCVGSLCQSCELTRTELDILLFLANNPGYDTAAQICDVRFLAKSHVSVSLSSLKRAGLLIAASEANDKRRIHYKLTDKAARVVEEGHKRQLEFAEIILDGFSEEEREVFHSYMDRMEKNIVTYLEKHVR